MSAPLIHYFLRAYGFSSSSFARAINSTQSDHESMLHRAAAFETSTASDFIFGALSAFTFGLAAGIYGVISYFNSHSKSACWAELGLHAATIPAYTNDSGKNEIVFESPYGIVVIRDINEDELATLNTKRNLDKHPEEFTEAISISIDGVEEIAGGINLVAMQKNTRSDAYTNKNAYLKYLKSDDVNLNKAILLHAIDAYPSGLTNAHNNTNLIEEIKLAHGHFLENIDESSLSQYDSNIIDYISDIDKAATALQKLIRQFDVTSVKEPRADVPALRDANLQAIAYKILPDDQAHFPYIPFPKKVAAYRAKGGYKTLTHRAVQAEKNKLCYVGLTLENPSSETLDPRFLTVIAENNLDKIKPQIRVNQSLLIAEDLGEFDLYTLLVRKQYTFHSDHFKSLASNIDTLHSLNIVHRDIKLNNIFFINGDMYLTDLDTMGTVGTFSYNIGTRDCLAPVFLYQGMRIVHDNADRNQPINAYKKDQYTFLVAMITACLSIKTKLSLFNEEQINQFLSAMPCSISMKNELKLFLLNPDAHRLPSPLADYLDS